MAKHEFVISYCTILQVRDRQTGSQTLAQLYIAQATTVGLWAFANSAELFNTAPLTNTPITTLIMSYW